MKNKLITAFISLVIILISCVLYIYDVPPFFEVAQKIDDTNYFFTKNKPSKDVVFVAVDEKSVNEFGRWPWKRSIIAKGIENLSEASVVLLDMTFSEPTEPNEDRALAKAIYKNQNTISGFFLRSSALEDLDLKRKSILSFSTLERIESKNLNLPAADYAEASIESILKASAMNASFSIFPDKDKMFRRYPLGFIYDNSVYPSLGIQGLRFYLNEDISIKQNKNSIRAKFSKNIINFENKGVIRLNYYHIQDYKIISFADIINGNIKAEAIKNKIVIAGITEAGITDIRSTPVGAIPGPLLHYTFVSNVLNQNLIKEPKFYTLGLIFLLGIIPFLSSIALKKITPRIFLNLSVAAAFIVFAKAIYISSNIWVTILFPLSAILINLFVTEIILFKIHEKEAQFVKDAFSAYVSPVLLKKLAKNPKKLQLGGEEKELTTLFLDIRNFTTISESLSSSELVFMLRELFNPLTKIIQDNNGFVDKYIGDAIMAFYNAPASIENHAECACKSALEMIKFMKSEELKQRVNIGFDLNIGVGINTGQAVVGNTGADNRFNYTALGDSVNLASRLQDLNKTYKTSILISENTYNLVKDKFLARKIESVKVKGKTRSVTVYELMENTDLNLKIKKMFEKGLESGLKDDFEKCYNETQDKVSKVFIERFT